MKRLAPAILLLLLPLLSSPWSGPDRLRRVAVEVGPSWVGVTGPARLGLKLLMEDLAETSGATVLEVRPEDGPPPSGITVLTLEGTQAGSRLQLQARIQLPGRGPRDLAPQDEDPRRQMEQLLAGTGLRSPLAGDLLPAQGEDLLPLAEAYASTLLGGDQEALAAASSAQALAARDPRCASAALARAEALYRGLLLRSPASLEAQGDCAQAFEASLALLPGFPRAARYAGRFYTDTGNQRQALVILLGASARWPRSPALRSGLAYAARTTGLLAGAQAALGVETQLEGDGSTQDPLTENTYLYTGAWGRFAASLGPGSPDRPDPMGDFYRGYLRLLQGRRAEALECFRRAALPVGLSEQFQSLAKAYQWALEGHRPEALLLLRTLAQSRRGLRVPDGEFTFKVAEAYGFLDDPEDAMEAAQLAFSQGFGCTDWYARTPLLAGLHGLPRWRALLAHLQERQRLLERDFPVQAFEARP